VNVSRFYEYANECHIVTTVRKTKAEPDGFFCEMKPHQVEEKSAIQLSIYARVVDFN
jgi:hypothetical protein